MPLFILFVFILGSLDVVFGSLDKVTSFELYKIQKGFVFLGLSQFWLLSCIAQ